MLIEKYKTRYAELRLAEKVLIRKEFIWQLKETIYS